MVYLGKYFMANKETKILNNINPSTLLTRVKETEEKAKQIIAKTSENLEEFEESLKLELKELKAKNLKLLKTFKEETKDFVEAFSLEYLKEAKEALELQLKKLEDAFNKQKEKALKILIGDQDDR